MSELADSLEHAAAASPAVAPQTQRWPLVRVGAHTLLLLTAWVVLQLWGLGNAPFHSKGEPREGLVVWEMTHGGGWILPRRNGVELPSKPPLFHWLGALTSLLHGETDEWSIRFPSAALSLIGLLGVFATGASLWTPRAGLFSALALMTTFEWARAATNARVDMTLTVGLELAFLSLLFFLRTRRAGWLVPLYLGITLAVLGKGPVGAVLPGLVALTMVVLARDAGALRQMRLGYGTLVVSLGAGTWYVLALILGGYAFFRKQVLAENVFTFLQSATLSGGHRHGVGYLAGALLLNLLPWTLVLPSVGGRLWRARRQLSVGDARVYLIVWIAVVFGFYAIAASKRSVYLLALYPAVALLVGWWFDEQGRAGTDEARWLAWLLPVVAWPLAIAGGLASLALLFESLGAPLCAIIEPWLPVSAQPFPSVVSGILRDESRWFLGCLVVSTVAIAGSIPAARARRWALVFVMLFVAVSATSVYARQAILPGIMRQLSPKQFMAAVRRVVGSEEPLSFYKTFNYGAVFYRQGHIPIYEGPWPGRAPNYLLMERAQWNRIKSSAVGQFGRVDLPEDGTHNPLQRLVLVRRGSAQ